MSTCEGCFLSAKGQAAELSRIIKEAKNYAVQNQTTVAVYKEGNEYRYIAAASAAGLPVLQYVSQYN